MHKLFITARIVSVQQLRFKGNCLFFASNNLLNRHKKSDPWVAFLRHAPD
ncbi:hypothetical protein C942_02934 [Photobacterium marinum]|uniref:Uncharacterized protein n=1 Tax=Photobacterium marinum TaxID=1056511 RepID=L8J9J9_9GAMM|nr:hypothetical protein C942_02934 [Photobacterium marinum]